MRWEIQQPPGSREGEVRERSQEGRWEGLKGSQRQEAGNGPEGGPGESGSRGSLHLRRAERGTELPLPRPPRQARRHPKREPPTRAAVCPRNRSASAPSVQPSNPIPLFTGVPRPLAGTLGGGSGSRVHEAHLHCTACGLLRAEVCVSV